MVSGTPTVIENGKILDDNMRKLRYTLDSLAQSLREKWRRSSTLAY
nr:YetF domain-containing protein [Paenibacillus monticola]